MNKLIADKWVKALRSGEYTQGTDRLQSSYGFCCLGVLCKVGELEGVEVIKNEHIGQIEGSELISQEAIKEWSGIKTNTCESYVIPTKTNKINQRNLAYLNDSGEYDFNKIADLIEEHWEQL